MARYEQHASVRHRWRLADAAEFAQVLVQVTSEWEAGCRRTFGATQSEDPFNVYALVAECGRPRSTGGGVQA